MWTQIVGKVRLELTPKVNHWWNVALLYERTRADHLNYSLRRTRF